MSTVWGWAEEGLEFSLRPPPRFVIGTCCLPRPSRGMLPGLRSFNVVLCCVCVGVVWAAPARPNGGGLAGRRGLLSQARFVEHLRAFAVGPWSPPDSPDGGPLLFRAHPSGDDFRAGGMHRAGAFWREAIVAACCPPATREILLSVVHRGLNILSFYKDPGTLYNDGEGFLGHPNKRSHLPHERLIPRMHFRSRALDPLPAHLGVAEHVMREKVQELLATGAARRLPKGERPWVTSPLTLAVNGAATKVRLIHDLRGLNHFLSPPPFTFPTLRWFVKGVDPDHLLVSTDWKSAYHTILLDEASQSLCGFEFEGEFYVMVALPFGLCVAPFLFQAGTEVFFAFLRKHGRLHAFGFIDDGAASTGPRFGQSAYSRGRAIAWLLCEGSYLAGHAVAVPKCQLEPCSSLRHLGLWLHADTQTFVIPRDKLDRFLTLLRELQATGTAQVKQLQRLAGQLVSLTAAVPCALVFLREIFDAVAQALRAGARVVAVGAAAVAEALQALSDIELWSGHFPWPSDSHLAVRVLATDASTTGIAGALVVPGPEEGAPLLHRYRRGLHPSEGEQHIMISEARAVLEAVQEFHGLLRGSHTRILVDNESTRIALSGRGARNLELNALVKEVWNLLIRHAIHPVFDRVASEQNVVADKDSRVRMRPGHVWRATAVAPRAHLLLSLELPRFVPLYHRPVSEIRLHPRLVEEALRFAVSAGIGGLTLDLFATDASKVVPRYVGLLPEPGARGQVAVDAFSFAKVQGEVLFCNPPWHLFAAVRNHLRRVQARGVWVFPDDPHAMWHPAVVDASVHRMVLAPAGAKDTFISSDRVLPNGYTDLSIAGFDFRPHP